MTTLKTVPFPALSAVRDDPYPLYQRLHKDGPAAWIDGRNTLLVTGHAEASALLRHPSVGSHNFEQRLSGLAPSRRTEYDRLTRLVEPQMVFKDGPEHRRIRGCVQKAFTPRAVREAIPAVQGLVKELLQNVGERFDVIAHLAQPLPAQVICTMLGVPSEDRDQFIAWSHSLVDFVGRSSVDEDFLRRTQLELSAWGDYCGELACHATKGSVLETMYSAHLQARLNWDEVLANAMFLLAAGHETTTNLIGNGLRALLADHQEYDRLVRDPQLIPNGVEEMLRYDSPLQVTFRTCLGNVEVAETDVTAGTDLVILIGAANRDPRTYADPDRLDLGRDDARHLAFADGPHVCLGAGLARMEGACVFEALSAIYPTLQADGPTQYRDNAVFRGLYSLPVST